MICVSKSCESDVSIGVGSLSPGGFNLIALTTNKAKSHDHIFTQVVTRVSTNAHKRKQAYRCGNLGVRIPTDVHSKRIDALTG